MELVSPSSNIFIQTGAAAPQQLIKGLVARGHQLRDVTIYQMHTEGIAPYADPEWKDVFTAALKRQKVVPGLDGGFVVLGSSTRKMTKQEMGDLMELMAAFGAERGVIFADERYQ
jgi:hypothetical protein